MAAQQEVSGSAEDLAHLIDAGEIETPLLMGFNDWQTWRTGAGRRPTRARDGAFMPQGLEARLWRATMAANHGEDWQIDLEAQNAGGFRADDVEEEEATTEAAGPALQARSAGELLHPGSAARTASPGSGVHTPRRSSRQAASDPPGSPGSWRSDVPGTPGGLSQTINKTFDLANESLIAALRE